MSKSTEIICRCQKFTVVTQIKENNYYRKEVQTNTSGTLSSFTITDLFILALVLYRTRVNKSKRNTTAVLYLIPYLVLVHRFV